MKLTKDDIRTSYSDFVMGKKYEDDYEVELKAPLNNVTAIDALDALEHTETAQEKAEFVRKLLKGNTVTITLYGEVVANFIVNDGFQWFACDELNKNPSALRFLIGAVYGEFLKNFAPHLSDSQRQVRNQLEQQTSQVV